MHLTICSKVQLSGGIYFKPAQHWNHLVSQIFQDRAKCQQYSKQFIFLFSKLDAKYILLIYNFQ